jgi:hypothetical protein
VLPPEVLPRGVLPPEVLPPEVLPPAPTLLVLLEQATDAIPRAKTTPQNLGEKFIRPMCDYRSAPVKRRYHRVAFANAFGAFLYGRTCLRARACVVRGLAW